MTKPIHNLAAHDPLCPAQLARCHCELCDPYCACDILAQARADERQQAAQRVIYVIDEEHPRTCDWAPTRYEAQLIAAARGEDMK